MNLRARIAKLFGFPTPAGGNVPDYPETMIGNPYRLERLNWDFPLAMRRVGIVRACVLRIAEDLAQLPVVFEREAGGGEFEPLKRAGGNIVDVWAKMNDEQTEFELKRDLWAHRIASGNAYLVAETFGTKKVRELWLMPPQYVRVIPGARRKLAAFVFNRSGREESIPGEWVVHFKGYTPDFEPVGASDLEAIEFQYSTRYDIARLMQLFVRNGGMPAGYFRLLGADGKPSTQVLGEPEVKRLQSQVAKLFGGLTAAFKPRILSALSFDRLGLTPNEMALIEQAKLADEDICRALGVPPWMVGVKESAGKLGDSGGAAAQDRGIYIRNTLLPKIAMFDAVLTERLVPMFGETGVRARTDTSRLLELSLPLVNSAQQVTALTGGPVLTTNEARKLFGQPLDPGERSDTLRESAVVDVSAPAPGAQGTAASDPAPAPKPEAKSRMIEGDQSRERARKKASATLARYERRMSAMFAGLLADQRKRLIARLEAEGLRAREGRRAINLEDVLSPDPEDLSALERLLAQLVSERGDEVLSDLAMEMQLNANSGRAASFVTANAQRALSLIDATTREAVRRQIAEGLALNETTAQIVERIRQMSEFGQARALMIARTETVSAFNFATTEAYEQSGVVDGVEWLSARDSAVRPTHAEADGQVVAVGQPFTVGGMPMDFPGDPGADPSETVNCRCTTLPVVNERARARRHFQGWLSRVLGSAAREGAHS